MSDALEVSKGRREERLLTRFCYECSRPLERLSVQRLRCHHCGVTWVMVEETGEEAKNA